SWGYLHIRRRITAGRGGRFLARRRSRVRSSFLGAGLGAFRPRSGFGSAAHVDAGAIATRHFRIGEARDQHAPVERDDLAVARTAGRILARADVILPVRPALEAELGRLRLVGEMHDDAAARSAADAVGLTALSARRGLGARAVFLLVIGGKAPAAAEILRRNAGGQRRGHGRRLRGGRGADAEGELLRGAAGQGESREGDRRRTRRTQANGHRRPSSIPTQATRVPPGRSSTMLNAPGRIVSAPLT